MRIEMMDGKCPICGKEASHVKVWPISKTISAWCDSCGHGLKGIAYVFAYTLKDGREVWKIWRPTPSKNGHHVSFTDYASKEKAQKVADKYNSQ